MAANVTVFDRAGSVLAQLTSTNGTTSWDAPTTGLYWATVNHRVLRPGTSGGKSYAFEDHWASHSVVMF